LFSLDQNSDGPFECRLDQVSYDPSPLKEGLDSIVYDLQSELEEIPTDTDNDAMQWCIDNAASRIGGWCIDQSAFHKDAEFSEEEEWRSVRTYRLEGSELEKNMIEGKGPGVFGKVIQEFQRELVKRRQVRVGRYGLTPYINVAIQPEFINEIVCGPRTAKELTESSLKMLMKKFGFVFEISRSKATYR